MACKSSSLFWWSDQAGERRPYRQMTEAIRLMSILLEHVAFFFCKINILNCYFSVLKYGRQSMLLTETLIFGHNKKFLKNQTNPKLKTDNLSHFLWLQSARFLPFFNVGLMFFPFQIQYTFLSFQVNIKQSCKKSSENVLYRLIACHVKRFIYHHRAYNEDLCNVWLARLVFQRR